jgi:hypothetical protein
VGVSLETVEAREEAREMYVAGLLRSGFQRLTLDEQVQFLLDFCRDSYERQRALLELKGVLTRRKLN